MNLFPHSNKSWLRFIPLPLYSLPIATVSPLSIKDGHFTKAAQTTLKAVRDDDHGLKYLETGNYIWDRLFEYVSLVPFSNRNIPGQVYRMWECPDVPQMAPPQLASAQRRLQSLILTNAHRQPILLHNNEDVREVCNLHVYDVLNTYLEMRYSNALPEHPIDEDFRSLSYDQSFNSQQAAQMGIYYPRWIQSVRKMNPDQSKKASGFADRILVRYPEAISRVTMDLRRKKAERVHCAIGEAKPIQAYNVQDFADILVGREGVVYRNGFFHTLPNGHAGGELLRQIWGQCYFLGPKVGFTTNLNGVIIFIQDLTEKNGKLILSPILPWTDDRLLSCLVALSFMAIDAPKWANLDVNGNPTGPNLKDMLAPVRECSPIPASRSSRGHSCIGSDGT